MSKLNERAAVRLEGAVESPWAAGDEAADCSGAQEKHEDGGHVLKGTQEGSVLAMCPASEHGRAGIALYEWDDRSPRRAGQTGQKRRSAHGDRQEHQG